MRVRKKSHSLALAAFLTHSHSHLQVYLNRNVTDGQKCKINAAHCHVLWFVRYRGNMQSGGQLLTGSASDRCSFVIGVGLEYEF